MEVFGPGGGIQAKDLRGTNLFEGNGFFDISFDINPAISLEQDKDTEVNIQGNEIFSFLGNGRSAINIQTVDPATGEPITLRVFLRGNHIEAVSLAEPLVSLFVASGTELRAQVTGNRFIQYGSPPALYRETVGGATSWLDLNAGGDPAGRNSSNQTAVLVRRGTAESHVANIDVPSDGPTTAAAVAGDNDFAGVVAIDDGGLFLPGDGLDPDGARLDGASLPLETFAAALDQILAASSADEDESDPVDLVMDLLLSRQG